MPTTLTLPKLDEYFGLDKEELINRFARSLDALDPRIAELSAEEVDTAFLASAGVGKLPVRVVVGHLTDSDLVWIHRMRRTVAEAHPLLADWDHDAFIDAGLYGLVSPEEGREARPAPPVGASMAAMHAARQWTASWLATLEDTDWNRTAMHPEAGEITLRRMVELLVWHVEYHNRFIAAKIDAMRAGA
ncbi:MAG: DinB family protein [Planctomycetota bacterium]